MASVDSQIVTPYQRLVLEWDIYPYFPELLLAVVRIERVCCYDTLAIRDGDGVYENEALNFA